MELPIVENAAPVGTLRVTRQGLYTVFQARLPAAEPPVAAACHCEHSDAREARDDPSSAVTDVTGVAIRTPVPEKEKTDCHVASLLAMTEEASPAPAAPALTRLWLQDADGAAAPLGLLRPGPEGRSLLRRLTRLDCRALPSRPVRALALPADAPAPMSPAEQCSALRDCPVPAVGAGVLDGPSVAPAPASPWQPRPDGSLLDPARRLLALPWAGGPLPAPARKITWNGREYWLFRY